MEDEYSVLGNGVSTCERCRRPSSGQSHMTALVPLVPVLVPLLVLLSTCWRGAAAMCPPRCQCNDAELRASCTRAALQVVPIQLNPELRHINLSHNKINSVHFTLEIYANLITLDVSHNRIQKLGSANFLSQSHLIALNLSHNDIETLDKESFKGLRSLRVLELSANHLEDIAPNAFSELANLEALFLHNNKLMSFEPELFKHQTNLRVLQLDDNQLLEIPAENLAHTALLERLSMSRNLVDCVEEGSLPTLKHLRYLALDSNVITDIHGSAFDGFVALQVLNLADNNFTSVPTAQLSKLANLVELNLSGNFFLAVPPVAFRGLFKLRKLHLNGVETLKRVDVRAFVDNINLESVWMDDNIVLGSIPTRLFHGNPRLRHVSMRDNMLVTLAASHFPLDQLESLHIGDNPLHCNCSLMWLWKLVTEQQESLGTDWRVENVTEGMEVPEEASSTERSDVEMVLDVNAIRCAGPEELGGLLLVEARESDIRCSPNWVAVATGSGTAVCVLAVVIVALLYSGVLGRCVGRGRGRGQGKNYMRRERTSRESSAAYVGEAAPSERPRARDKCDMMGPPLLSEYQTLPTWENYAAGKDIDLYRQFGYHTNSTHPSRPHVVYV